jgi:hypothetical protein
MCNEGALKAESHIHSQDSSTLQNDGMVGRQNTVLLGPILLVDRKSGWNLGEVYGKIRDF